MSRASIPTRLILSIAAGVVVLVILVSVIQSPFGWAIWVGDLFGRATATDDAHDGHAAHGGDVERLILSESARKNLELEVGEVSSRPYHRTITLPAIVDEIPGKSRVEVSAPVTGIVTRVRVGQGAVVGPSQRLFDLRLIHEDVVDVQTRFLEALGRLDVELEELKRLDGLAASGVVAGRVKLERVYEKKKLEASIEAYREALQLHGLEGEQITKIETSRKLQANIVVSRPDLAGKGEPPEGDALVVLKLHVREGDSVSTGDKLATLANYQILHLEGQGFERDVSILSRARTEQWPLTAIAGDQRVEGLQIEYLAHDVDETSRILTFCIRLENEVTNRQSTPEGERLSWRFRPGQRMKVLVPTEVWKDKIVLPVDAVAEDGPNSFVFLENGEKDNGDRIFVRHPVHVEYRDQTSVVIGSGLFPSDVVAMNNAHLMLVALKNQAGAGTDPHAGHTH